MGSSQGKQQPQPRPAAIPVVPVAHAKIVHGSPLPYQGEQVAGAAIARSQREAYELDAADGVLDGKFYGAQIRIIPHNKEPVVAPAASNYHSLPPHKHAQVPIHYDDPRPLYPVPVEDRYLDVAPSYTRSHYARSYTRGDFVPGGKVIDVEYRRVSGSGRSYGPPIHDYDHIPPYERRIRDYERRPTYEREPPHARSWTRDYGPSRDYAPPLDFGPDRRFDGFRPHHRSPAGYPPLPMQQSMPAYQSAQTYTYGDLQYGPATKIKSIEYVTHDPNHPVTSHPAEHHHHHHAPPAPPSLNVVHETPQQYPHYVTQPMYQTPTVPAVRSYYDTYSRFAKVDFHTIGTSPYAHMEGQEAEQYQQQQPMYEQQQYVQEEPQPQQHQTPAWALDLPPTKATAEQMDAPAPVASKAPPKSANVNPILAAVAAAKASTTAPLPDWRDVDAPPPPPPRSYGSGTGFGGGGGGDQTLGGFDADTSARMAFRRYDTDGNGFLDIYEFMAAMKALGIGQTFKEAQDAFGEIDTDGGGSIEEEEFVAWYVRNFAAIREINDPKKLAQSIFRKYDKDGNGTLDVEEFVGAMRELGLGYSLEDAQYVFDTFDNDGGGTIDEQEFINQYYEQWVQQQ